MPCYKPLDVWKAHGGGITFDLKKGFVDQPLRIACGRCVGCRLERSRQWAVRCVHEAKMYDDNCFITLTYRDEDLPKDQSLVKNHFQKFMKRLRSWHRRKRKAYFREYCKSRGLNVRGREAQKFFTRLFKRWWKSKGYGIRYFHCGEYGGKHGRPHYHACLFNFDFEDRTSWQIRRGVKLDRSASLEQLWPYGFSTVGDVTFESAAYVARYIMKKQTGEKAVLHYNDIDLSTGEIYAERLPEYVTMSRRPGIGRPWLEKYKTDVYPEDFVVLNGKKFRPPKYYDSIFELDHEEEFGKVKRKRKTFAKQNLLNSTWERLEVREEVQKRKLDLLIRGLENEI